jgi:hypothetical protein
MTQIVAHLLRHGVVWSQRFDQQFKVSILCGVNCAIPNWEDFESQSLEALTCLSVLTPGARSQIVADLLQKRFALSLHSDYTTEKAAFASAPSASPAAAR